MKRLRSKITIKDLLYKALFNSVVGLPISMLANIAVIPPLAGYIHDYPLMGSIILSAPFFIISMSRQFLIDYFFHFYGIIIDPRYYIEKIITRLRSI